MAYSLGVDLGTTYTAAAVVAGDGVPRVVQLTADSQAMPSVVSLRDDGEMLVGEVAERRAVTHPARTVREFKRRFGDPAPVVIGGKAFGVDALTGHLLLDVIRRVTAVEGEPPARVALAHPASWGPFRLDLLRTAGEVAGVGEVSLVPEPIAAAIANRDRVPDGALVAVYDLGGGTFDAAVVRCGADAEVVGTPEGVERLGGVDFDQAVMAHVDTAVGGAVFALDAADPEARAALARLRDDCRIAKETLSSDTEAEIPVMLPSVRTSVRLTRAEFETLIRGRLADSLAVLDRVVASTGLGWEAIDRVLLVGGSSRIPLVAQLVQEHTGRPVVSATNPAFAIALGTAQTLRPAVAPTVVPVAAAPAPTRIAEPSPPDPGSGRVAPARRRRTGLFVGVGVVAVAGIIGMVLALGGGGGGGGGDGDGGGSGDTSVTSSSVTPSSVTPSSVAVNTTESAVASSAPAASVPASTAPAGTAPAPTALPADGRPVAAPVDLMAAGVRLAPVACATGAALDGATRIAATPTQLFALIGDTVTAITIDASDGCAVALDTSVFADGVVAVDATVTDLAAGAGVLAISSRSGGMLVDTTSGVSTPCPLLADRVTVVPGGEEALTWDPDGAADVLSLATGTCALVADDRVDIDGLQEVVALPTFWLGVMKGDPLWLVRRFETATIVWTHGGPRSKPVEPYQAIDGVTPCGPLVCVLDLAADRLHLLNAAGDDKVAASLSGLLGIPPVSMADLAPTDEDAGYLLATVEQAGQAYSYLFRLAVA